MIATCHKIFRLRNLRQSFPGVGFNPYPQRCRTQHFFHREAVAGRSAGCGHAWPPPFNGIKLFNTSTMDADYLTDTRGVLVRHAARRPPVWPSEPPPAAHTPGDLTRHVCAARHCLRRSLLWPAATSFGCLARRWWAGSSLRDNDGEAPSAAGGYFSSVPCRERVIRGAFGSGSRVCVRTYPCCAFVCCICAENRPESASVPCPPL